jgi:hypothetical protein
MLVLGDCRLFGGAAPGGPAAESFRYHRIGAVEGAEADRADELAAGQGLQLAGQQRPGQDGHAAVERDVVSQAEPGAAVRVQAERGDVQERVGIEDLAVRELAAQRPRHRGLAGPAGPGDHEQRQIGHLLLVAAAGAAQHRPVAAFNGNPGSAVHAEHFLGSLGCHRAILPVHGLPVARFLCARLQGRAHSIDPVATR